MEDRADFSQVPVVVLESLRIRLSQLVHSLTALSNRVHSAQLPAWPMLQQQFNVVLLQLSSLTSTLSSFAPTLQKSVIYPTTTFPVQTHGWLLTTLLRKKNLPEVEEYISEGIEVSKTLDPEVDDQFCTWALEALTQLPMLPQVSNDSILRMNAQPSLTGWNLDSVVAFMSGKHD